ncbi:MAG: hypothetical protein M3282_09420 [Gemmatimonadota bacterium]|nr:hypothetical protein [Gemmatimonadota bacterium]
MLSKPTRSVERAMVARMAVAVAVSAALPVSAYGCSKAAFTMAFPANFVYFVGYARADTLPVSAADLPVDPFHRGAARPSDWRPPAFGQSARVRRIGGTVTADRRGELERALVTSDSVVVLVPWETDIGCAPMPWRASARWMRARTEGLFRGRLRARTAWVRGIPTLDVLSPTIEPYPSGPSGTSSRPSSIARGPWLTPVELFELFQALPIDSMLRRQPEAATEPLRRWAESNPTLAARYPAAEILRQARWGVYHYRTRLTPLPLAGTYRFTVGLSDGQSFSFYARTETVPAGTWEDAQVASEADSLDWFRSVTHPPAGYYAEAFAARTERELPRTRTEAERRHQPYYSFQIGASPSDDERGGVQHWRGAVDFAWEALPVLATDSASRARLRELAELTRQVSNLGDPRALPATFRRSPNGRVEVRQQLRLRDGRVLTIRGVRVSDAAVAPQ